MSEYRKIGKYNYWLLYSIDPITKVQKPLKIFEAVSDLLRVYDRMLRVADIANLHYRRLNPSASEYDASLLYPQEDGYRNVTLVEHRERHHDPNVIIFPCGKPWKHMETIYKVSEAIELMK